jgi:hypothetical protein
MNEYWFKPKRYGYGATPVTWEGWALLGLYGAVMVFAIAMLSADGRTPSGSLAYAAVVVVSTTLMIVITIRRTRGEWRWRWGGNDDSRKVG